VKIWLRLILLISNGLISSNTHAEEALVAVAVNFVPTMRQLVSEFESKTTHRITIVSGSTGQLYAQILNKAPYHIFLAADQERPAQLLKQDLAVEGTQFTYALGKLVLWTNSPKLKSNLSLNSVNGDYNHFAIANPLLAPYGVAAKQTLMSLGLWDVLQPKLVMGQNVSQAYAMISTLNAEIGLIALSNLVAHNKNGVSILIPENLYTPIFQDGVLTNEGAFNLAALSMIEFLKGYQASRIIIRGGYELP
tara:strand:+ start:742 stop:1491 length:750 start_codon:yes stop_codon:yes gene_type:complete